MADVEWDYTELAQAYVHRPDYAAEALDRMFEISGARPGMRACDVGAGVGHLTIPLLRHGLQVDAVEPNDRMRGLGASRTADFADVRWHDGTGERTHMSASAYHLVTFGSSFNVCDRARALVEAARLLAGGGWFICLWNHRDLMSSLQQAVEAVIRRRVPNYDYGTRREDQTTTIAASGLFEPAVHVCGRVEHVFSRNSWRKAWRSHATLARQAGDAFDATIDDIAALVADRERVVVSYQTNVWLARKLN